MTETEVKTVVERMERFEVQLAGCGVAALGGVSPYYLAAPDSYGWSPAYADVVKLRLAFERLAGGRSPDQVLEDTSKPTEVAHEQQAQS